MLKIYYSTLLKSSNILSLTALNLKKIQNEIDNKLLKADCIRNL